MSLFRWFRPLFCLLCLLCGSGWSVACSPSNPHLDELRASFDIIFHVGCSEQSLALCEEDARRRCGNVIDEAEAELRDSDAILLEDLSPIRLRDGVDDSRELGLRSWFIDDNGSGEMWEEGTSPRGPLDLTCNPTCMLFSPFERGDLVNEAGELTLDGRPGVDGVDLSQLDGCE